ncbi:hypothetical protein BDY19DRAFT_978759 [Irpex rosettiformis]|uniref:Uncharacterized protein n=1 Tax=Irpex rosettiformis TaxID=378272 RepID=A0ACB8TN40_9APHY|nr:hypothetical protein BDY19DRAFT_978759 [Irpex rosettiformis]
MPAQRRKITYRPRNIPCTSPGCLLKFSTVSGLKRHLNTHTTPGSHSRPGSPHQLDNLDDGIHTPPPQLNTPGLSVLGESTPRSPSLVPPLASQSSTVEDTRQHEHLDDIPNHANHDTSSETSPHILKHPYLDGTPCDADGYDLEPTNPRPVHEPVADYKPFNNRTEFELADFFYREAQLSGKKLDKLMDLLAAYYGDDIPPPFANSHDLHNAIDAISAGEVPWQSFTISYSGTKPAANVPQWMEDEYTVWYRCPRQLLINQIGNRSFAQEMDWAPKRVYRRGLKREYEDFMSGNWAWEEADRIAVDPSTHGAALCPVILGSDKTTVSVATGQNEYYPAYISNGMVSNGARRAHRDAVSLFAFLAIPKTDRQHETDPLFRKFRRQLFHTALHHILEPLRCGMETPEVVRCADDNYRRIVWSLGPYIADYPEQVLLSGIVQGWCPRCTAPSSNLDGDGYGRRSHIHTNTLLKAFDTKTLWDDYGIVSDIVPFTVGFPRADIHQLLAPDLLHQVIKGTFKDHLVTWLEEYLVLEHGKAGAAVIMADIDRRIAAVPNFPGLRRFPQGRGFKQWTGDDSKALMKVWLPAIAGHVPGQMVRAFAAFLEFCYLVRCDVINEDTLTEIDNALSRYHKERTIFETAGVRMDGFSLPRQHSLKHYCHVIQQFGAPNGLCSSITESKHIKAVKQPWRRSNRYKALGQMLLAAVRVKFDTHDMLDTPAVPLHMGHSEGDDARAVNPSAEDEDGEAVDGDIEAEVLLSKTPVRKVPRDVCGLAEYLSVPRLEEFMRRFLFEQLHPDNDPLAVSLNDCPPIMSKVYLYPSASAMFCAPSDHSGVQGMRRERIRSVMEWHGGDPRHDCVFLTKDTRLPGFRGLYVVRVHAFLSFKWCQTMYPCALVSWFLPIGDSPCSDTGMWMVRPEYERGTGARVMSVVHTDSMVHGAHLIGMAGREYLPSNISHTDSLDIFRGFYVNKYADHHSHTIAY